MSLGLSTIITDGVAWVSTSSAIIKVVGILYTILVLGHLSVYEFGVVELLLSIPPLMSILSMPGLEQVVMSDIGKERGHGNQKHMQYILESYMTLRIPLAILSWALMFFSAPYVEQYYNEAIATMVRILSFSFLLSPLRTLFMITFQVGLQYKYTALFRVAEEVGKLAVVSFCFLALDLSVVAVIWGYVCADIIGMMALAASYRKIRWKVFGRFQITGGWKNPLYALKHHGKWSVFGSYLDTFSQNLRPWLIKLFLGTHAVGIFAVALGMYQNTMSLIPIGQVTTPLVPQFLSKKEQLFQLLNSAVKYQLIASLLASLIMIAMMPVLIHFFFPAYADAYLLFICMLSTAIPSSLSSIYHSVFFAMKAQRDLFVANVVRVFSVACIMPIVLPLFGLYGIAIEFFLTAAIYSYNRYLKVHALLPDFRFSVRDLISVTEIDRLLYRLIIERVRGVFNTFLFRL